MEDAFNRFFAGEAVLLVDMQDAVGDDNKALLTLVINVGYICGLVGKFYTTEGQKRNLTGMGIAFYNLIKSLYEAGA